MYSETLAAGRIASAEKFDFDACFLRIDAYDSGSHLLFADACNIEPSYSGKAALERLFAGKGIWSTIFILSDKDNIAPLEKEIGDEIHDSSVLAGCTILPMNAGLSSECLTIQLTRLSRRKQPLLALYALM